MTRKPKKNMEQQPHHVNERNQTKNKSRHIQFTTRSIVRFSSQTMQWYH